MKLSHFIVKFSYADRCHWWELEMQKAQLIGLRRVADVYLNFYLFNLAGNQDRTSKPKAYAEFEKAQMIGLRTEADDYFNFDLLNLAGEPRSVLESKGTG